MNVLVWILFGLVVGAVANLIYPRPARGNRLSSMVLGVAGAIVGGFLGSILFGIDVGKFNFPSLAVAVAGALVVLLVGRMLGRGLAGM